MKRLLSLMLCLCLIWVGLMECPGADALAEDVQQMLIIEIDGFHIGITGSEAEIVSFDGSETKHLTIPSTLGDNPAYTIVGIASNAFYGRVQNLETLTIPETVRSIGETAFGNCQHFAEARFEGTRDKWEQVSKGANWDGGKNVKVICRAAVAVSFRVENGSWDDGSAGEKGVTLSGFEDELMLAATDIPAVGSKPNDGYKAGTWDTEPKAGAVIDRDTVFTYTYAEKEKISHTVTFSVKNGAWDDGTKADKTVTLSGYVDETLKLQAADIPAVGGKPDDGYKAGAWDTEPKAGAVIDRDTVFTYTYAEKEKISHIVTFSVKNGAWDDGTTEDKIVSLSGYADETLKLQAADIPAVGSKPDEEYKAGSWNPVPYDGLEITADTLFTYTYEKEAPTEKLDLKDAEIANIPKKYYTSSAIEPEPKVTYNGVKLEKGTDYTVSYKNNKKVGTATVTITATKNGKYTGEKK